MVIKLMGNCKRERQGMKDSFRLRLSADIIEASLTNLYLNIYLAALAARYNIYAPHQKISA